MTKDQPNRKSLRKRLGISLTIVVLALLSTAVWQIDDWSRDLSTNFAQTSTDAKDPLLRPTLTQADLHEIDRAMRRFLTTQPSWSLTSFHERPANQELGYSLTRTTALLRFVDDVDVLVSVSFDGSLIETKSKSRVGKGDLGQNPRNIRELNAWLREELGGAAVGQP